MPKKHPLVMLIDDSAIDNFVNKKMITRYEYADEVLEFNKTSKALKHLLHLNNNPELPLPSIIFLDLDMPEINGLEFLSAFDFFSERIRKNIKVIILTCSIDPIDVQLCKKYKSVLTFLHKPLMKNNLSQIDELLLEKNSKLVMN